MSSFATRPIAHARHLRALAALAALAAIATLLALALSSGGSRAGSVREPVAQPQYIGGHAEYRPPGIQIPATDLGQRPGARP